MPHAHVGRRWSRGDYNRVSSSDSLSSRLIAGRTSAPPLAAFAPWDAAGETECPRNINDKVVPHVLLRNRMAHSGIPKLCREDSTLAGLFYADLMSLLIIVAKRS